MNDLALSLLLEKVDGSRQLWIVDERGVDELLPLLNSSYLLNITFLTNRYDQYLAIKKYTENVFLNDFEFGVFDKNSFDKILFRVSKEKAVVHHCINSAANLLAANGQLILSGFKNDGVQTYIKKAVKYLGVLDEKKLGGKTSAIATICREGELGDSLDDTNYPALSLITVDDFSFYSKPGVFGWKKVDKGSELLIEIFKEYIKTKPVDFKHVLDLGCGYGFLSLAIYNLLQDIEGIKFFATDNNMAALRSCEENFKQFAINGEVFASDAGARPKTNLQVDLLICNPPFHQGFQHQEELTVKFIRNTKRLLASQGIAFWVVNAFIPVERLAKPLFSRIELLANNGQFKVYLLAV